MTSLGWLGRKTSTQTNKQKVYVWVAAKLRKGPILHIQTTKSLTRQHICAFWSVPLLSTYRFGGGQKYLHRIARAPERVSFLLKTISQLIKERKERKKSKKRDEMYFCLYSSMLSFLSVFSHLIRWCQVYLPIKHSLWIYSGPLSARQLPWRADNGPL